MVEPIGSTLRALVEARHRDTVISFDPNVRLNVEPSHAVWREHIEWMASRTHLLKLSDEDFERLYPGEDIEALGSALYKIPKQIEKFADFINYDKVVTYKDFGGIRNEEDYLITENGARLLGKKIPVRAEEVEAIRK